MRRMILLLDAFPLTPQRRCRGDLRIVFEYPS